MAVNWIILTGEYPPQSGGVSDYTAQVAHGLAAAGDVVHVFAPPCEGSGRPPDATVQVHRLPDCFQRASLRIVEQQIDSIPRPRRILVQYVPHAFGKRGVNLTFSRWLRRVARREFVDVMFHEVASPLVRGQKFRHRVLAWLTRRMAYQVGMRADRLFASTASWEPLVREIGLTQPMQSLPIPSNFAPRSKSEPSTPGDETRSRGTPFLLGHFGTFGLFIEPVVRQVVIELARRHPEWTFVLVGRGGEPCRSRICQESPEITSRIRATGMLESNVLTETLQSCDLLVQPYPDGITTRRTSVMAGLCLGVPVVSNRGTLTESLWLDTNAIVLADDARWQTLADRIETATRDAELLPALGRRGRAFYEANFDLRQTISALRRDIGTSE